MLRRCPVLWGKGDRGRGPPPPWWAQAMGPGRPRGRVCSRSLGVAFGRKHSPAAPASLRGPGGLKSRISRKMRGTEKEKKEKDHGNFWKPGVGGQSRCRAMSRRRVSIRWAVACWPRGAAGGPRRAGPSVSTRGKCSAKTFRKTRTRIPSCCPGRCRYGRYGGPPGAQKSPHFRRVITTLHCYTHRRHRVDPLALRLAGLAQPRTAPGARGKGRGGQE